MKRKNSIMYKSISCIVICTFCMNNIATADIVVEKMDLTKEFLQVESPFKPISELIGRKYENQMKVEAALILAMMSRGENIYKINMELEKACSVYNEEKRERRIRLFDVIDPEIKEEGKKIFNISVRHGKAKGTIFTISSSLENISEKQAGDNLGTKKALLKVEKIGKQERVFWEEKSRIKAPYQLYSLRTECYKEREKVLANNATSIIVDPNTQKKQYLTYGKELKAIEGEVFFLEDGAWDIPEGVEFPKNLKEIINTEHGSLVITTGPFYENKYKNLFIPVKRDPTIRKLEDKEIYERFKLKRVYDHRGKMFTLPVLGLGGKTLLVPVSYHIKLVKRGRGIGIVTAKEGLKERTVIKPVFGLEFKNTGTIAYSGHNKSPGKYPVFPPTIFERYVGLPGIFLDWEYCLVNREPIGLNFCREKLIDWEKDLLQKGAELTRWTLATSLLAKDFEIKLRVPVGDYRRLSSFFSKYDVLSKEIFYETIKELGKTPEKYLLELAKVYGKNLRSNIDVGIIQPKHGSLVNSDINGKGTDFEDFLIISKLTPENIKRTTKDWIENLIKIITFAELDGQREDSCIKEFVASFFYVSPEKIILDKNKTGRVDIEKVKEDITAFILEKQEKENYLAEDYKVKGIREENNEERKVVLIGKNNEEYSLTLKEVAEPRELVLLSKLLGKISLEDKGRKEVHYLIRQFNKTDTRFRAFNYAVENLFGFVSAQDNLIAIREDLYDNPSAVFILMMESLMKKRALKLSLENNRLLARIGAYLGTFDVERTLKQLMAEGVINKELEEKEIKDSRYYLLRLLSRKLLGETDKSFFESLSLDKKCSHLRKVSPKEIKEKEKVLNTIDNILGGLNSSSSSKRERSLEILLSFLEAGLIGKTEVRHFSLLKVIGQGLRNISLEISKKSAQILALMVEKKLITKEEALQQMELGSLFGEINSTKAQGKLRAIEILSILVKAKLFNLEENKKSEVISSIILELKSSREKEEQYYLVKALTLLVDMGAVTAEILEKEKKKKKNRDKTIVQQLLCWMEEEKSAQKLDEALQREKYKIADIELLYNLIQKDIVKYSDFKPTTFSDVLLNKIRVLDVLKKMLFDAAPEIGAKAAECLVLLKDKKIINNKRIHDGEIKGKLLNGIDIYEELAKEVALGKEKGVFAAIKIKHLVKGKIINPRTMKAKLDLKKIVTELNEAAEMKQIYSAEIIMEFIEADFFNKKDIKETLMMKFLTETKNKKGDISIKSAEVLCRLLEKKLIKKENLKDVSFERTKAMLKKNDQKTRTLASKVICSLVQDGLIRKNEIPAEETMEMLLEDIWDIGDQRAVGTAEALKQLINQKVIKIPEFNKNGLFQIKKAFLKTFETELSEEYFIYYLRLLPYIRSDNSAILRSSEYLTQELLSLSKLNEDYFYKRLAEEIRKGTSPKEVEDILRDDLLQYLIKESQNDGNDNRVSLSAQKLGRLIAGVFNRKEKIKKTMFDGFRTIGIDFSDGGICSSTHSDIVENCLFFLPQQKFNPLPISFPKYEKLSDKKIFIADKDYMLRIGLDSLMYVATLGRTLIFKTKKGKYTAIKICKQGEDPGKLVYENKMFGFLNLLKKEGVGLTGEYPRPLLSIHNGTIRVKEQDLPREIKKQIKDLEKHSLKNDESISLKNERGQYFLMLYETDSLEYFTYLQEVPEGILWEDAVNKNIKDLFVLAGYGIIHPDICELFHNITGNRENIDQGKYLWMVDIVRRIRGRAGAGRLHAWKQNIKYPNMRLSGPADFAEMIQIEDLISLQHEHSQYLYEDLKRYSPGEREKYILAHFLGNYFFTLMLLEGDRKLFFTEQNRTDEDIVQELSKEMERVYSVAYKAFTGREEKEVSEIIQWERLANQMLFFMGGKYKQFKNKELPENLFGLKNVYIVAGEGWGYIHKSVIAEAIGKVVQGKYFKEVLENYFDEVIGTENRSFKNTYKFKKKASLLISKEKDEEIRKQLTSLFKEYSNGWRINGINEDLGPMNGSFSIQEGIKANYIAIMMMIGKGVIKPFEVNRDIEQIGKRAFIDKIVRREKENRIEVTVVDEEVYKHKIILEESKEINIEKVKDFFRQSTEIKRSVLSLLEIICSIAEKEKVEIYTFDRIITDLLGFSIVGDKIIAVNKGLEKDPIAVFHEILGYLISKKIINIEIRKQNIFLFGKIGTYVLDASDAIEAFQAEKEEWAFWRTEHLNKASHYLLRIFQRVLFSEEDKNLSKKIKELVIEEKLNKYKKGFGLSFNNFYDLLSFIEDSLQDENSRAKVVATEILMILLEKGLISKEEVKKKIPINMLCKMINDEISTESLIAILKDLIVAKIFSKKEIREKIDVIKIIKILNGETPGVKTEVIKKLDGLIDSGVCSRQEIFESIDLDEIIKKIKRGNITEKRAEVEVLSFLLGIEVVTKQKIENIFPTEVFLKKLGNKKADVGEYYYTLETMSKLMRKGVFKNEMKDKRSKEVFLFFIKESLIGTKSSFKAEAIKALRGQINLKQITKKEIEAEGLPELIAAAISSPEKGANIIRACREALTGLIVALGNKGETIAKGIPVGELCQDISKARSLKALKSAQALSSFVKNGIVEKKNVAQLVPLRQLFDNLEKGSLLDKRTESVYLMARVLEEFISAEVFSLEECEKEKILRSDKLLHIGIQSWNFDKIKALKTIKALIGSDLLMKIGQRDLIHETVKEILPEEEKLFSKEDDPIYLQVGALLKKKNKNIVNKYFTPKIIRLLKLGDSDLPKELVLEIENKTEETEAYKKIKEQLLYRYLIIYDKVFNSQALKELFFVAKKTGKIIGYGLSQGEKIPEKIKDMFKTLFVEIKEDGQIIDTTSYIFESAIQELPMLTFKELPIKMPVYQDVRQEQYPILSQEKTLSFYNKKSFGEKEEVELIKVLGRTVVYKNEKNRYIALKFLKQGEAPGKLLYENRIFDFLNKLKEQGVNLKGKYPKPIFFDCNEKKERVVSVTAKQLPGTEDIIKEIEKTIRLKEEKSTYTLMAYETEDMDYFTYLDGVTDSEKAHQSLEDNLHDLSVLAQYGLIHPDLIRLYHNELFDSRSDYGKYIWMIDVVKPGADRLGAGRLESWERILDYNNMRVSGPADFAEIISIKKLMSLENEHSRYLLNNLIRFEPKQREKFLLSYFIGNYIFISLLNEVKRMKKDGKVSNEKEIEDIARKIYETVYKSFVGEDTVSDITALVNWKRLARQISFFMTDEYKEYSDKFLPEELYGIKGSSKREANAEKYIHVDIIKNELLSSGIDEGEIKKIFASYFHKAEPSQGRTQVKNMYVFRENFKKTIREEKNLGIKKRMIALSEKDSEGGQANSKEEDLGPRNGPLPLAETIKANYLFTMAMMARFQGGRKHKVKQKKEEKKKAEPEVLRVKRYDSYAQEMKVNLEVLEKNTFNLKKITLEVKEKEQLTEEIKKVLIESVKEKNKPIFKKLLSILPRFMKINSFPGGEHNLIDIVFIPERGDMENFDLIAGREEVIEDPYYKFYLLTLAFLDYVEKKITFTVPFEVDLKKDFLILNVGGEIVQHDISEAKKSLLKEGCDWVELPDSIFNLKRNKKYRIRLLCRSLFGDKDRALWQKKREVFKEIDFEENEANEKRKDRIYKFVQLDEIKKELTHDIKITPSRHKSLETFYLQYLETQRAFLSQRPSAPLSYLYECFNAKRIADMFYLYQEYGFNVLDLTGSNRATFWEKDGKRYEISLIGKDQLRMVQKIGKDKERLIGTANSKSYGRRGYSKNSEKDQERNLNLGNFLIKVHNYILWTEDSKKYFETEIKSSGGEKLINYYRTIGFDIRKTTHTGDNAARELFGGIDAGILLEKNVYKIKDLTPFVWKVWSQRELDRYLKLIEEKEEASLAKAYQQINLFLETKTIAERRQYSPEKIFTMIELSKTVRELRIGKKTELFYLEKTKQEEVEIIVKQEAGEFEGFYGKKIEIDEIKERLKKIHFREDGHKALVLKVAQLLENSPPDIFSFKILSEDFFGKALPFKQILLLHDSLLADPIAILHELLEYYSYGKERKINVRLKGVLVKFVYYSGIYKMLRFLGISTNFIVGQLIVCDNATAEEIIIKKIRGESLALALKDPKNTHYLLRSLQRELMPEQDKELTGKIILEQKRALVEKIRERITISENSEKAFIGLVEELIDEKIYRKNNKAQILRFLEELTFNKEANESEAFDLAKEFLIQGLAGEDDLLFLADTIFNFLEFSERDSKNKDLGKDIYRGLRKEEPESFKHLLSEIKKQNLNKSFFSIRTLGPLINKTSKYSASEMLNIVRILGAYNHTYDQGNNAEIKSFIEKVSSSSTLGEIEDLVVRGASKSLLEIDFLLALFDKAKPRIKEVLSAVKIIVETGMVTQENFSHFRKFIDSVMLETFGRRLEPERINFIVNITKKGILFEAGFEKIIIFIQTLQEKGFFQLNEKEMFEVLNGMVDIEVLTAERLTPVIKMFSLIREKNMAGQLQLLITIKEYLSFLKERGGSREFADPDFFINILEKKENSEYLLEEIVSLLKKTGFYQPNISSIKTWLKNCETPDQELLEFFINLSAQEQETYVNNREKFMDEIQKGQMQRDFIYHLISGYELLVQNFKKKNINLVNLPGFQEYRRILTREKTVYDILSEKNKAEIKYSAYEAVKLREFLLKLKKEADKQARPMIVVKNRNFGKLALFLLEEELRAKGVKVIESAAVDFSDKVYQGVFPVGKEAADTFLFEEDDLTFIIKKEPFVVIVDGSSSIDQKRNSGDAPHFSDSFQVYRNYFYTISQDPKDDKFGMEELWDRRGKLLTETIKESDAYSFLRKKAEGIKRNRANYELFFWHPGREELSINNNIVSGEVPQERQLYNIYNPDKPFLDKITGPSLIFINANMSDESLPEDIKIKSNLFLDKRESIYHNSGYFNYNQWVDVFSVKVGEKGPEEIDIFKSFYRAEYNSLKKKFLLKKSVKQNVAMELKEEELYQKVLEELNDVIEFNDDTKEELKKDISKYTKKVFVHSQRGVEINVRYLTWEFDKKRISDIFYLKKKYEFNIFELLASGKTMWINKEKGMKYQIEYDKEQKHQVLIEDNGSEGKEGISPASVKKGDCLYEDWKKNKGRNIQNFINEIHQMVLWLDEGETKKIQSFSRDKNAEKFEEDHHTLYFSLEGGIEGGILSAGEKEKIKDLDPRIWREWSQREIDKFFVLINEYSPETVRKACKEFSSIHKDQPRIILTRISPLSVSAYINYYVSEEEVTADTERIIAEILWDMDKHVDKTKSKEPRKTENLIIESNHKSLGILKLLERIKDKYSLFEKSIPIDIVVDLTLIPKKDEQQNLDTWAQLILMCRDMKNVNFIFEEPELSSKTLLQKELIVEIIKGAQEQEVLSILKEKLNKKIKQLNLFEDINVDEFFLKRINTGRREKAVEVLIISKIWLKWKEEISWRNSQVSPLEENQFPVAMEDMSYVGDETVLLRNFEAALSIGILKAQLVILKKQDKIIEQKDLKDIMSRLQAMYDVFKEFKPEFSKIIVDEYFINNMISEYPVLRLEHAIKMALPAITRMLIEELSQYHEIIRAVLQAA